MMTSTEFAAATETIDFLIADAICGVDGEGAAFDIHDEDDWIEMTTESDDLDLMRFSAFDA